MKGPSIVQARSALRQAIDRLRPQDSFNIIAFANHAQRIFPASVPATDAWRDQALLAVDDLRPGGGTEIHQALVTALDDQGPDLGIRQVVFITDGAVHQVHETYTVIEQNLGRSRLFLVGIGTAPNHALMRRAARFGRGTFTSIGHLDQVAVQMSNLFHKLERPVLAGLDVRWQDANAQTWPARIPDLYDGQPLVVAARLPKGQTEVEVSGSVAGRSWQRHMLPGPGLAASGIDRLWARRQIEVLMDEMISGPDIEPLQQRVTELGLRHGLVTRFTSLVAVDRTPTAPPGTAPALRPTPSPLPAGWQGGSLPATATGSGLWLCIGMAAALLALLLIGRPATRQ